MALFTHIETVGSLFCIVIRLVLHRWLRCCPSLPPIVSHGHRSCLVLKRPQVLTFRLLKHYSRDRGLGYCPSPSHGDWYLLPALPDVYPHRQCDVPACTCIICVCGTAMDSKLVSDHQHGQNDCTSMHIHTVTVYGIQHNQFIWLVAATNQLPPLTCGQLVHNRATSCTNVPSSCPLFVAVYPLIRVSVYTVSV